MASASLTLTLPAHFDRFLKYQDRTARAVSLSSEWVLPSRPTATALPPIRSVQTLSTVCRWSGRASAIGLYDTVARRAVCPRRLFILLHLMECCNSYRPTSLSPA